MKRNDPIDVLNAEQSGGNFTKLVTLQNGSTEIQRFCFASGMASLHWRYQYAKKLKEPVPEWVALAHPAVCSELCQIAIADRQLLPRKQPAAKESEVWEPNYGIKNQWVLT